MDVYKRDNYICRLCKQRGQDLIVHHNKFFAEIIKNNNIKTIDEAINCKELWDTDNGITLHKSCHIELHKVLRYASNQGVIDGVITWN